MSLFGDLPPLSHDRPLGNTASSIERNRASTAAVSRWLPTSPAPAPRKSALKRPAVDTEGGDVEANAQAATRPKKHVRFQTFEVVGDDKVEASIAKISSHISNPSKLAKAAKLASQLLTSGSITSKNAGTYFTILSAAMKDPSQSLLPDLAPHYRQLFMDCSQHLTPLLPPNQQSQLDVWQLWAVLNNSLSLTDDSFEFSRIAASIQKEIELLPEATAAEDEAQSDIVAPLTAKDRLGASEAAAQAETSSPSSAKDDNAAVTAAAASGPARAAADVVRVDSTALLSGSAQAPASARREVPGDQSLEDGEGSGVLPDKRSEGGPTVHKHLGDDPFGIESVMEENDSREFRSDDDPFGINQMITAQGDAERKGDEDDPFGLGALIAKRGNILSKREMKAKRKREAQEAAKEAAAEAARVLRDRREALIVCLNTAASKYKNRWAQTSVDILVSHAYNNRSRFIANQRTAVEKLWFSVKEQQQRRKQGKGATGKLDVTSFERLADMYARDKISIRKGVGDSGGRGSLTWLG